MKLLQGTGEQKGKFSSGQKLRGRRDARELGAMPAAAPRDTLVNT